MLEMEKGNWPVDAEVSLFHAMRGHKPVGVNRHFQMVFIHDKINTSANRKISSKDIWDHLVTMYDLQALNESEIVPFPNKEVEFALPAEEFQEIINKEYPRMSNTANEDEKIEVKPDPPKDSHSTKAKAEKVEPKQLENKHASNVIHANTPENSPKRKRTRNTPSASPATPDVPPTKRRR